MSSLEVKNNASFDSVPLRVVFHVYGCQMNKADAELLQGAWGAARDGGVEFINDESEADAILFFTCSVRAQAENRVWANLGRLKALKKDKPGLVIAVLGCMAQKETKEIWRKAPHVDLVLGTRALQKAPELVEAIRNGAPPVVETPETGDIPLAGIMPRRRNRFQAWLPVMRGCNKKCSYCVVPHTRGPEKSRPLPELVEDAKRLAGDGAREITLLGQTIDTYGSDLDNPGWNLANLLKSLHEISDLWRINYITSYPAPRSEDIFRAVAECERVSRYVHLPVQSGSDAVLKRMRRGYRSERFRELVYKAREMVEGLEIATDAIVGFSGETDSEFMETVNLFEELRFRSAFIFRYSPREGTPAAKLPDDVPDAVKRERQQVLLKLQEEVSGRLNREMTGRRVEVLVEGRSRRDETRWTGRTATQRITVFPVNGKQDLTGCLVDVKILDSTPLTLYGSGEVRIVERPQGRP